VSLVVTDYLLLSKIIIRDLWINASVSTQLLFFIYTPNNYGVFDLFRFEIAIFIEYEIGFFTVRKLCTIRL
jgi:hypothetical protein